MGGPMVGSVNAATPHSGGRARRHGALLAGLFLTALGTACPDCGADPLGGADAGGTATTSGGPVACVPATQTCAERESFRDGTCQNTFCETDAECCPSTRCDLAFNLCRTRLNDSPCETVLDCPKAGQDCVMAGGTQVCVFPRCEEQTDCADGLSCFKGRCVGGNPCDACDATEVCDVATGSCHPAVGHEGCGVTCGVGEIKALTDPASMSGEICCAWECECVALPPLSPGVFGQYASVSVAHLEVAVASYDLTYGDLVLSSYNRDGQLLSIDYVDGYPLTGQVEGDPEGPRKGIKAPGPDVGRWASSAIDSLGRVHVAYFDETNGALKHALRTSAKEWEIHVVDDTAVAGQFASLAIRASDGAPVIAYFSTGLVNAMNHTLSGPKLAVASTPNPSLPTDWTLTLLEEAEDFDACNQACNGPGSMCVLGSGDGGAGGVCATVAPACTPACSSAQACVLEGATPTCVGLGNPPIGGLPRALGTFTSVAMKGDEPVVAWHDAVNGLLKAAVVPVTGAPEIVILDGDGVADHSNGRCGAWSSVAVDAVGKIGIVYVDETRHELKFFHSSDITAGGTMHVVDTGRGMPPGFHEVGAGASLAMAQDGTAYVVYQEQTNLDLMIAEREPDGNWSVTPLLTEGPFGFYTDVGLGSEHAYVVSVKAALDARPQVANQLGLMIVEVPLP